MTDVTDMSRVVGTPLGTSDHCYVNCVLRVEQYVPEYNVRSTVFPKYRTNFDTSTVQSGALHGARFWIHLMHWMHSTEPLVGLFLPLFWEVDLEYSEALHLFIQVVGDAERLDLWCETLYSCSHGAQRWFGGRSCWESLTPGLSVWQQAVSWAVCLIFLSCFSKSRCNSLAFRASVLHLFLNLYTYGVVDPLCVFALFLKKVADIIASKLKIIFCMLIRSRIVSGVLAVCQCNSHSQMCSIW